MGDIEAPSSSQRSQSVLKSVLPSKEFATSRKGMLLIAEVSGCWRAVILPRSHILHILAWSTVCRTAAPTVITHTHEAALLLPHRDCDLHLSKKDVSIEEVVCLQQLCFCCSGVKTRRFGYFMALALWLNAEMTDYLQKEKQQN
ncbi:hypothetical protein ATANTOWER_016332 [Ataeniobius toweri]|uniref:Uncharacterized protein n=1 Tax=Ataeniobius toweri TaxID=208326 RepID=A0ABU7BTM4_9TELE|nr:hypothetical protein [Ataeniobius toweri]